MRSTNRPMIVIHTYHVEISCEPQIIWLAMGHNWVADNGRVYHQTWLNSRHGLKSWVIWPAKCWYHGISTFCDFKTVNWECFSATCSQPFSRILTSTNMIKVNQLEDHLMTPPGLHHFSPSYPSLAQYHPWQVRPAPEASYRWEVDPKEFPLSFNADLMLM